MRLVKIVKSENPTKKYDAYVETRDSVKKISFGAAGMSDYTHHKDPERKKRYIARHKANEDFNDPLTAGFWSRWYLWNLPTKKESLEDLKRRFKL
jgi:hypothetical protein